METASGNADAAQDLLDSRTQRKRFWRFFWPSGTQDQIRL